MEWFEVVLAILGTLAGIVIATIAIISRIGAFKESIKQDMEKGLNEAREDRQRIRDDFKDFINLLIRRVEGRVRRTESQIDVLTGHLLNREGDYNIAEERETSEAKRERDKIINQLSIRQAKRKG